MRPITRATWLLAFIAWCSATWAAPGQSTSGVPSQLIGTSPSAVTSTTLGITLPSGQVGVSYNHNARNNFYCPTNATPTYTIAWSSSVPGLSLASSGVISGTPTTAGSYSISGTITDVSGLPGACTATAFIASLTILPARPACTVSASNLNPAVNTSITLTASCTNSPTSYSWTGCSSTTST